MASYMILFKFTQQGVQNIRESPARVDLAKKTFQSMGVKVKDFYALMGRYDTVFITEAPEDETMAKACLAVASSGNVHTETLRAFNEDEFRKIVAALP